MADNTSEPKLTIFADLLRAQLKEQGISQRELAARLGMTPQALGNYTNSRTQPGYEVLLQIARALDISPQALVPQSLSESIKALLIKEL